MIKIFQRKIKSNTIREKDGRLDNLKLETPTKKTTLNFLLKDKGKNIGKVYDKLISLSLQVTEQDTYNRKMAKDTSVHEFIFYPYPKILKLIFRERKTQCDVREKH